MIKLAGKILPPLAIVLLLGTSPAISAQTPQATPPPPAPPRSLEVPRPTEKTLPNGLRVIVIERSSTPLVSAQLLIKSGGEVDRQLAGLADMTASLLTKGTGTRSATQIAEAIEALGGSLDSGARWDASSVTVGVMSAKIAPAMEILADVSRHPVFKDEEIERLRQQDLDSLTVELGEPGSIARFAAARVVFGDGPYGHPLGGTPESLTLIKRDDILKLHQKEYNPRNAILVIGGDIKPADAFRLAEKYFGDWQNPPLIRSPAPEAGVYGYPPQIKHNVLVIDKPDAGQAAVLVVRRGIKRTDVDYFRGLVANSVLTGYSGRLNEEIRIKRGLSYGAGSVLDARRDVGPFVASAQTKNESGAKVADLLIGEVGRLATEPLLDSELAPRKAALVGNFARNLEQVNGLVAQVGGLALQGLPLDSINHYINDVQSVSAGAVQRFAGTKLNAKDSNIIIVGNAREFLPELQKQFTDIEVIPIAELDLNNATLRKRVSGASNE